MNRQLREKVLDLAKLVRYWAEEEADEYSKDLCGWCAICSAELHKRLEKAGISALIVMQNGSMGSHVFLNVDGWIVDVTATQFKEFRNKKVVLLHEKESEQFDFYEPDQVFTSVKDLVKWQIKAGWPVRQTAKL